MNEIRFDKPNEGQARVKRTRSGFTARIVKSRRQVRLIVNNLTRNASPDRNGKAKNILSFFAALPLKNKIFGYNREVGDSILKICAFR